MQEKPQRVVSPRHVEGSQYGFPGILLEQMTTQN